MKRILAFLFFLLLTLSVEAVPHYVGDASGLTNLTFAALASTPFNTTYVSKNGTNATGRVHDIAHPFLSISNAAYASHLVQSGTNWEVVHVDSGVYNENNIGWPYVAVIGNFDIHFEPNDLVDTVGAPIMGDDTHGYGHGAGAYKLYCDSIYYSRGTNFPVLISPGDTGVFFAMGINNCNGAFYFTNTASTYDIHVNGDCRSLDLSGGQLVANAYFFNVINGAGGSSLAFHDFIDVIGTNTITMAADCSTGLFGPAGGNDFAGFPAQATSGAQCFHWSAGELTVNFHHCNQAIGGSNPFWVDQETVASSTYNTEQHLYLTGQRLDGDIYTSGASTNCVMWADINLIDNPSGNALALFGGKNYIHSKKVLGGSVNNNQGYQSPIQISGDGVSYNVINWLYIDKLDSKFGPYVYVIGGGISTTYLTVQQYEPLTASMTNGIVNTGGTLHLIGGDMTLPVGSVGIAHLGGKTIIEGSMNIDTSASSATNCWPIFVSHSGLDIGDAKLTAPSAASFAIWSTNAQTITSWNAKGNKPAGGNITVTHPQNTY